MRIKEISYGLKKGLPGFSSVSATAIAEINEEDELDLVWDKLRQEVEIQCGEDPSWITRGGEKDV